MFHVLQEEGIKFLNDSQNALGIAIWVTLFRL